MTTVMITVSIIRIAIIMALILRTMLMLTQTMTMMTLMVMVVVEVFCKVSPVFSSEILLWLPSGDFYTISDWLVQRRCLAGTSFVSFVPKLHDKLRSIPTQVTNFIQSNRFPRTFGEASGCRYFPSRFSWKPTKRCATTKTEEAIADRNNINAIPACPHDLRLGPSVWREKGGGSAQTAKNLVYETLQFRSFLQKGAFLL